VKKWDDNEEDQLKLGRKEFLKLEGKIKLHF